MVPTAIVYAMYVCLKDFMCLTLALSVNCYCVGSRVRACYILICRARSGLGWAGWGCDCGGCMAGLSEKQKVFGGQLSLLAKYEDMTT
jgi:hypothetical protein